MKHDYGTSPSSMGLTIRTIRVSEVRAPMLARWGEAFMNLEEDNKRLQEYYEASMAVEEGVVSFDLQHEAVERLEKAQAAIVQQEGK